MGGRIALFVLGAVAVAWATDAGVEADAEVDDGKVTIIVRTRPEVRAGVYHGRKKLGNTPLKLTRDQDSGPLDLMVRATGFLPVATRAYTFKDDKVDVAMTRVENAHTVYGYREPLDAGLPDGGAAVVEEEGTPDEDAPPASQPSSP